MLMVISMRYEASGKQFHPILEPLLGLTVFKSVETSRRGRVIEAEGRSEGKYRNTKRTSKREGDIGATLHQ